MRDDLNPQNGPAREPERRGRAEPTRPSAEQQVPLSRTPTPASVQAWLDGELPEAAVRRGETAKDVDFWKNLNQETDARRRMKTPAYVYDNIMNALPQTTPTVITPWWRRPFAMTPAVAVAVAAGILAVGAVIATFVMR